MRRTIKAFLICMLVSAATAASASSAITKVALSRTEMNAAAGDQVQIFVTLARAGTLSVAVLDRDGHPVRFLSKNDSGVAGTNAFTWDGRSAAGEVVPDEAYSLKVDWRSGAESDLYFPANRTAPVTSIDPRYYSRRNATLAYELPVASRVHIQAGVATKDRKTGKTDGPVMKTVVNREPRAAGRIAEQWNGMDESGAIYVPDLPNFAIAIAASPLPENSLVTIGNRKETFVDHAARRQGQSLFTFRVASHAHHAALATLDDISPRLKLEPLNAEWSPSERTWILRGPVLRVRATVEGPSAAAFASHPATVARYVGGRLLGRTRPRGEQPVLEFPASAVADTGVVSVNWTSEYGPVAANAMRVRVEARR